MIRFAVKLLIFALYPPVKLFALVGKGLAQVVGVKGRPEGVLSNDWQEPEE
ncbi:hypothetical protein LCGC14_1319250 [marine sediment metagenome]|uniref:Uncharacterized protein n=1 Tax=marine sediment metagenome TaxID=412755 RepID=A0A0F9L5A0_9ZZZZ